MITIDNSIVLIYYNAKISVVTFSVITVLILRITAMVLNARFRDNQARYTSNIKIELFNININAERFRPSRGLFSKRSKKNSKD